MNRTITLLAGALALATSTTLLRAQTDLGTRYVDAGLVVYDEDYIETGYGIGAKFSFPVSRNIDLHVKGSTVVWEDDGWVEAGTTAQAGITFHSQLKGAHPFVTLEAGIEVTDYEYDFGYDAREDSALYTGTIGIECPIGDSFSIAPLAAYEIYYEVPGGDWYFGAQANVNFHEHFGVIGTLMTGPSSALIGVASARFKF